MLLDNGLLDSPDRRLLGLCRLGVIPVKILSKRIEPIVASIDPVGIENGHDLENKLVS